MTISINVLLLTAAVKAFTIFFFLCMCVCLGIKSTGPHLFCTQGNILHLPDICKNRSIYDNSPTNILKII